MATTDLPSQRQWRAACPNCGAPVEFRSPASEFAVCSFCRSTVVREGDALRKIGESAELFDDHSPLQLGASGRYQGETFTLVGRLQYGYAEGTWNEWHALFDNGRSGWLSEDNGRYVMAFDARLAGPVPPAQSLHVGEQQIVDGRPYVVASVTVSKLIAVQGELPAPPQAQREFVVADLRSTADEVGTLDYSRPQSPTWSVGRSVALAELSMTGLSETSEKTLSGRGIACPQCGAPLEITLASTKSVVCGQCRSVVDVSEGVGADLAHFTQAAGREPQIALGRTGRLTLTRAQALPWQVVGYAQKREISDDEPSSWSEYLLYNRTEGFAFLVDADEGWSWVAPITGVPQPAGDGVVHGGVRYRKLYDYVAETTYVLGEFYWKVQRLERSDNTDYAGTGQGRDKRLNRERTRSGDAEEIVWSAGETLSSDAVARAFALAPQQRAALSRDAAPTSGGGLAKAFMVMFAVAVVLLLFRCGGGDDCESLRSTYGAASYEYQNCLNQRGSGFRTRGGAFGGFSSGGGHK